MNDIDFARGQIRFGSGKGTKNQLTMPPACLGNSVLRRHDHIRATQRISMSDAAPSSFQGARAKQSSTRPQLRMARRPYDVKETDECRRRDMSQTPRAMAPAVRERHWQARELSRSPALPRDALIESGYDIPTVQELRGDKDVTTTFYTRTC